MECIKYEGKPQAFEKSRLKIQAYYDKDYGILTYAPTVKHVSQRLFLELCAIDKSIQFFTKDVYEAYVQAETPMQRKIFIVYKSNLTFRMEFSLKLRNRYMVFQRQISTGFVLIIITTYSSSLFVRRFATRVSFLQRMA